MATITDIILRTDYESAPYRGRGMDRACPSVRHETGELGRVLADMITAIDNDADRAVLARAIRGMRHDQLGLGEVTYFPTEKCE